ncbi:piwi-like protein 1 [Babylonia areolata]|uniref:piwi-like protein 1 n=1 Tax=Babylonia areolata TaxID=304850 RepID=UPI003FD13B9D
MASGGGPPPGKSMGRGGRGLAILQALKKEQVAPGQAPERSAVGQGGMPAGVRAPGMQPQQQPGQQAPQAQSLAASQPPQPLPHPALSQPLVSPPTPPPLAGAARPGFGGRGNLAGMLAMVQQQSGPRGRGGILAQAATVAAAAQKPVTGPGREAVPRPPVSQSPVAQAAAGEPAPPVAAMARMAVSDPVEGREERTRQPTVTRRGVPGKVGGQPSRLAVNYIELRAKNKNIYQYHVTFNPVIDSKGMRCGLLNEHKDKLPVKLFDGSIMYMPERLPQENTQLISTRRTDGAQISINIKFTKSLPTEQCPQLYNILLRKIMSILKLCQVGRYYYNPATPSQVPAHKLEVWPGYITSIREHEGGLMLLLDSSHRVLRCQTVLELMGQIIQERPNTFQDDITRQIVGCTVLTRYNNKTYRIDDIDWGKTPRSSFMTSNGQEITFADYYWNQYGKRVDMDQPLLVHRPKARVIGGQTVQPRTELICLIPGLCHLTGLTDDLRQNFRVMKDLGAHTRCTPSQRLVTMKKFVDSISRSPEARQQLENWGLSLDDTALAVEGRRMANENIFFGGGKHASSAIADWGRDLSHNKVFSAVNLERWVIFYTRRNTPDVMNFVQEAQRIGPPLGISVRNPEQVPLPDDKTETLVKALRESVNPRTQLVCVVMPTSREDKYSAVKKFACVECPVPSQVIIHKTIRDKGKLRSVTQKIVLQINCKLGGELWAVKNPLETAMVVGVDSFHDISRGRRSIGGFVASTNPELTRWFSRVRIQMQGEELVPGLRIFMVSALRKYHECNHRVPEKIIVFRDGVGDGQLPIVQDYEVSQILESFNDFGKDYHPKLTVVIVQKRINTRIFQKAEGGQLDNPPPGTVLDHTVTRRDQYDYFVVSQHVRQGTVSPTHYVVVHDEINLPPEKMQVFTYKMTHMYYNWPGTVRVPAPCLYAHKLAYLVGESIHKQPSELLSDRLFFL